MQIRLNPDFEWKHNMHILQRKRLAIKCAIANENYIIYMNRNNNQIIEHFNKRKELIEEYKEHEKNIFIHTKTL